jgi:hypothetical protein
MTGSLETLAQEAEFQLSAAREQFEWFSAIARAIAMNLEQGGGRDVRVLAQLAKYLGDTGAASVGSAAEQFERIAAESEGAHQ